MGPRFKVSSERLEKPGIELGTPDLKVSFAEMPNLCLASFLDSMQFTYFFYLFFDPNICTQMYAKKTYKQENYHVCVESNRKSLSLKSLFRSGLA